MSAQEKDVLDFLDSLPDQKNAGAAASDKTNVKGNNSSAAGGADSENVLDFLDQLEQTSKNSNKGKKASFKKTVKPGPTSAKKDPVKEEAPVVDSAAKVEENKEEHTEEVNLQDNETHTEEQREEAEEEHELTPLNDPITSFTSWWSNSSQTKFVGNLLNQTKQHIQDTLSKEENIKEYRNLVESHSKNVVSGLAKNLSKIIVGETSENLRIHVSHDIINWKFNSLIDEVFYDVLSSQVQDGVRIIVEEPTFKDSANVSSAEGAPKQGKTLDFQFFNGKLNDGEKLCMANLEDAIKRFESGHKAPQGTHGEQEVKREDEEESDRESDREFEADVSEVFISILPIAVPEVERAEDDMLIVDAHQAGNFSLTFILKDITNDITVLVRSQGFPIQWAKWIMKDESLESIDPGEWVRDWIEGGIKLSIQTLAQNYVLKRISVI